jgi:ElaB/YqjD/DUF883 family membrane-anchored ribosome-binding protein
MLQRGGFGRILKRERSMNEEKQQRSASGDVGEARAQVERNRERLSETLDALEDRLVETKTAIREKVDVLRPVKEQVRSRPWAAIAVAAGVGAAVGAALGGRGGPDVIGEDERRRRREWRKRRRARMRGDDSDVYSGRISEAVHPSRRRRARPKKASGSTMRTVRKQLMGAIASAVVAGLRDRARHAVNGGGSGRRGEAASPARDDAPRREREDTYVAY